MIPDINPPSPPPPPVPPPPGPVPVLPPKWYASVIVNKPIVGTLAGQPFRIDSGEIGVNVMPFRDPA